MTTNIETYNSAGLDTVFYAINSAAGYPYGSSGAIANGGDASMARLYGAESLSLPLQAPRQVDIPGDDGVQAIYLFPAVTLPNGTMVLGNIDLNLWAKSQGMLIYADGEYDVVVGQPDSPTFKQITLLVNAQAKSAASGSVGNAGYRVKIYPRVQIVPIGDQGQNNAAGASFTHQLIANISDKLPWGESFTVANYGTTRAAVWESFAEYRVCLHTHVADATDVTFTLSHTPVAATAAKIQVWRNGTLLTITTDWSISGAVITLVAAGTAGDVVTVRYQYSV